MYNRIQKDTVQVLLLDKHFSKIKSFRIDNNQKDDFQEYCLIEYKDIMDKLQKADILISQFNGNIEISASDNIQYWLKLKKDADGRYYLRLESQDNSIQALFYYSYDGFKTAIEYFLKNTEKTKENELHALYRTSYLYTIGFGLDGNNCEVILEIDRWKKAYLARLGIFNDFRKE